MKRTFKLATMLFVVLLVTGCGMKAEYGIKIGKDKNVNLEFVVAQDDELIDAMSGKSDGSNTDDARWEYLESQQSSEDADFKDFEKVKYDKDGYKGYTYKLALGNIENLVKDGDATDIDSLSKDSKMFTKKGDVYSLNIKLSDDQSSELEQYASSINFDLKLKVTLPVKAKSNNATSVEGTTYTWDLTKAKSIELSFDLNGAKSNNVVLIVGGVCAVAAIAIGVVVLTKKKNK